MRRSRFLWKLYGGYVLLILLTVSFIGVMVSRTIEQDSLSEIQESLLSRAQLLSGVLAVLPDSNRGDNGILQGLVQRLGAQISTRLTLIDSAGVVIADSEEDPALMDNHGSRPEVLEARSHGRGQATRFSNTLGTDMMYVVIPVFNEGAVTVYVRTSLPLIAVQARLTHLRRIIITGALITALIALPVGYLAARRFTAPLGDMTRFARDIARGNYERRVRSERSDEIGQLAVALNSMASQSQNRIETIARDRNRLVTTFAGMVEGVVAVDTDEQVILMNAVAGELLDADPDESIGRPIREVTRTSKISDILSDALSRSEPVTGEVRIVGTRRDCVMEAYGSQLRDFGEATTGAVVVLHDVSDLRRLESVRRDFVANVSHELKTPITAAKGLVETMLSDADMVEKTRLEFLDRVRAQIARLAILVSDLLTLSRIEAGDVERTELALDFSEIITAVVSDYQSAADLKKVHVDVKLPGTHVKLIANRDALVQIVGNLLDNAVKYSGADGRVAINLKADADRARLEVSDTGIGIEPMHHERIFERFYRVDKARSRELGGTGLGLAIVKHLVRTMEGAISLTSKLGEGSTFIVEFPLPPDTGAV